MESAESLLGISLPASANEIRSAYLRQISRYHPDKVHHLGDEFQRLAAEKSAALTSAYRFLLERADGYVEAKPGGAPEGDDQIRTEHAPAWASVAAACPPLIMGAAVDRLIQSIQAGCPRLEDLTIAGFAFAGRSCPDWRARLAGRGLADWREMLRKPPKHAVLVRVAPGESTEPPGRPGGIRRLVPDVDGAIVVFDISFRSSTLDRDQIPDRASARRGEPEVFTIKIDAKTWRCVLPPNVPDFVEAILSRVRSR